MNYRLLTLLPVLGVTLSACSTVPKAGTPEAAQWELEQRQEKVLSESRTGLEDTPDWFLETSCPSNLVCATATAVSKDLQLALDKAVLDGKFEAADKLSGVLSASMKRYIEEVGASTDPEINQETSKVIKNVITDMNMAGYRVAKKEVIPSRFGYRAFVLIEYPVGKANRVLVSKTNENALLDSKMRASKAFAELEEEIKAASK